MTVLLAWVGLSFCAFLLTSGVAALYWWRWRAAKLGTLRPARRPSVVAIRARNVEVARNYLLINAALALLMVYLAYSGLTWVGPVPPVIPIATAAFDAIWLALSVFVYRDWGRLLGIAAMAEAEVAAGLPQP